MRAFARALACNLAAGVKLALFLPVGKLAFRIGLGQLLALFAVSALCDVAADAMRYGADGTFSWYGLGSEVFSGGLLLLASAVFALFRRDRSLTLAIPVIALASFPVLQVANGLAWQRLGVPPGAAGFLEDAVLLWILAVLVRIVWVALEYCAPRRFIAAIAGGALLAAPIFLSSAIMPVEPWFSAAGRDAADPRYPNPASEPVLTEQARILDHALSDLEDGQPGVTDLYFVGFAGEPGRAIRDGVDEARGAMDQRWGTGGRSIVLANEPRTLLADPMATLSNLRDTLGEIGAAMDSDEDIAMVYLAARGNEAGELDVRLPPLELVPVSPALLRGAFDDAGIRYRVIVVSACNAGGFVDELADDDTAVVVASRGAASGACTAEAAGAFGDAFFRDGMREAASLDEAFDLATASLERRSPSIRPERRIGPGIAARFADLKRGGGAQRHARRGRTGTG